MNTNQRRLRNDHALIRKLSTVYRMTIRYLAFGGLCFSINEKYLLSFKNHHQGRRCFVIGNGPSLRIEDLQHLHDRGEICIASNKIYLIFEDTEWCPTYYTVGDVVVAENNADEIRKLDLIKFFPDHFKTLLGRTGDEGCNGVHIYYRMLEKRRSLNDLYKPSFSTSPLLGFHIGETITNVNIQLAYYLGCNPIYILGLDGKYRLPSKQVPHKYQGKVLVCNGENNHFISNYRRPGETWSIPRPREHETGFQYIKTCLHSKGVEIYNASRYSVVKAFKRVEMDEIL